MLVDIHDLVEHAGLQEPVYPGKRVVKAYQQPGQYKSHCMVFDWRDSHKLHVELKAGLSGSTLDQRELRNYPVMFQAATYVDIAMKKETAKKDKEEEEDEDDESKGKSGGGGKKPGEKKRLEDMGLSLSEFGRVTEGAIPNAGTITKFVVMGKELAKEAYQTAFENLKVQIGQTKVMAMDIMKGVSDVIRRATPGGGLQARGDETVKYKYDIEKNGPMFGAAPT